MRSRAAALGSVLSVAAASCAVHPPVTPLRYDAVTDPQPVDEAFRREPPAASPVVDVADTIITRSLANGLSIVYVPRHDLPLVTSVLVTLRGAVDLGDVGIGVDEMAHLFSKGGEAHGSAAITEATRDGASFALSTSLDSVLAQSRAPREAFVASLRRLALEAAKARLSAPEYERRESEWHRLAVARLASMEHGERRILFGDRVPYGVPLPLAARAPLSLADAQTLHDRLFRPGQCALVVVGDVTLVEVMAAAESELGSWDAGALLSRVSASIPERPAPRVAVMRRGYEQELAFVFARGPEHGSKEAVALAVASHIAGGATTSRLWDALREQGDSYASGVVVHDFRAATWVSLGGSFAATRATLGTRQILSSLSDLREGNVTEEDVALARTTLSASWRHALETHDGAALHYARRLMQGYPAESDFPAHVAAVTREDVIRVARVYFAEPSLHVLFVGDDRRLNIESLGMGPPTILDL